MEAFWSSGITVSKLGLKGKEEKLHSEPRALWMLNDPKSQAPFLGEAKRSNCDPDRTTPLKPDCIAYDYYIKLPRVKTDRHDALRHTSETLDHILPFYVEHLKTPALLNLARPEEWSEATIIFTRRPSGNKFMVSFLSNRGHFQFRASGR